jgi:hypothetical protein
MDEKTLEQRIAVLEARRDELEKEIDALEEVARGLEAEGLLPLVERLRAQVATMKKLVIAMAEAIDELLIKPQ